LRGQSRRADFHLPIQSLGPSGPLGLFLIIAICLAGARPPSIWVATKTPASLADNIKQDLPEGVIGPVFNHEYVRCVYAVNILSNQPVSVNFRIGTGHVSVGSRVLPSGAKLSEVRY